MPRVKKKKKSDKLSKILIASIFAISVLAIGYYFISKKREQAASFNKEKFTVRGVDLSHHNPIIDWNEVGDDKINFVYLKATGGISHKDRNYKYNYLAAKKSNIKVGSYHFYLFATSGKQQAQHFIRTAECESGDLFPAIDVEHSSDNPYSRDTSYVKIVIEELKILENELFEHYGLHPVIYTNKDCYKLYIDGNFSENLIWICDLHNEPTYVDNWIIWQFSHKGKLSSVVGNIDLNYFRYSYDSISKILIP